mmetsp:Transcript_13040/g.33003  ORF Transcript_13040/g.33003 Transcript_13040/m.33003 type:complete len:359 (-) Transcript_13040:298-1374(-)
MHSRLCCGSLRLHSIKGRVPCASPLATVANMPSTCASRRCLLAWEMQACSSCSSSRRCASPSCCCACLVAAVAVASAPSWRLPSAFRRATSARAASDSERAASASFSKREAVLCESRRPASADSSCSHSAPTRFFSAVSCLAAAARRRSTSARAVSEASLLIRITRSCSSFSFRSTARLSLRRLRSVSAAARRSSLRTRRPSSRCALASASLAILAEVLAAASRTDIFFSLTRSALLARPAQAASSSPFLRSAAIAAASRARRARSIRTRAARLVASRRAGAVATRSLSSSFCNLRARRCSLTSCCPKSNIRRWYTSSLASRAAYFSSVASAAFKRAFCVASSSSRSWFRFSISAQRS